MVAIVPLPVAHAHTSPTSLPVAMLLVLLYYILYYYYSKKKGRNIAQLPVAHAHILPREPLRSHVTFSHFR